MFLKYLTIYQAVDYPRVPTKRECVAKTDYSALDDFYRGIMFHSVICTLVPLVSQEDQRIHCPSNAQRIQEV